MSHLSRLIENINSSINFNLNKENHLKSSDIIDNPIQPVSSSWEETKEYGKNCLKKQFIFKSPKHIKYFLNECIEKSSKENYYPDIFIKENIVKISLSNNFSDNISYEDLQFSKFLDELFEDIFYINR